MAQSPIDGLPRDVALGGLFGRKKPETPRQAELLKMFDALDFTRQAPFRQSQDAVFNARAIEAAYADQMRNRPPPAILGVRASLADTTGSDLA